MLPFMQTMAGLSRLYQSFDDDQKKFADQMITSFGADWLGQRSDVDPELLNLVASPDTLENKLAAAIQNPNLMSNFMKKSKTQGLPEKLYLRCPHCESFFVKSTKPE